LSNNLPCQHNNTFPGLILHSRFVPEKEDDNGNLRAGTHGCPDYDFSGSIDAEG